MICLWQHLLHRSCCSVGFAQALQNVLQPSLDFFPLRILSNWASVRSMETKNREKRHLKLQDEADSFQKVSQ